MQSDAGTVQEYLAALPLDRREAISAVLVANVCDAVDVGPFAAGVLGKARATDASGRDMTVCMAGTDPVSLTQA